MADEHVLRENRVDKILFLWLPALAFLFPHIFLLTGGYYAWIMPDPREMGYVENATSLFFMIGGVYALALAFSPAARDVRFLRLALVLFSALAIWVSLEEISYGQVYFHMNTPEWFQQRNAQKEINLHNLYGNFLSYTMKTGGYVVVSLAGIVVPLVVHFRNIRLSPANVFYYFVPPTWMIVPSLFHLFANLPKNIVKNFDPEFADTSRYFSESGEYEEYMLGLWVILYVVTIHRRIREGRAFR